MILIHVTDSHLAPVGTRYRAPGFEDAIVAKLEQVGAIAREHRAPVIHTGDLFDLQNPRGVPRELVRRVMDLLAASGVTWYLMTGQHDLPGRDPSGYRRSPMALLDHHPAVQMVSGAEVLHQFTFPDGTRGMMLPYSHRLYEMLPLLPNLRAADKPDVLMVHGMVVPEPVPWTHVTFAQLAGAAPLVLSGDFHAGYPPTTLRDTMFVNPGALARVDRSEAYRTPQVAVVDTVSLEVHYTTLHHDPAEEVFDLVAAEEQAGREARRSEFAANLAGMRLDTAMSWDELSRYLPEEDAHVVERAHDYYYKASLGVSA